MNKEFLKSKFDPIHIPEQGPGQSAPPPQVFEQMGEENIKLMLKDFYHLLGQSSIAGMFPKDLDKASEKSALFFIGLLGGPPLYHQTYGHPRMRMRHMPFRITDAFREVWLGCFFKVLEEPSKYGLPEEHVEPFKKFLASFSAWMVNTQE